MTSETAYKDTVLHHKPQLYIKGGTSQGSHHHIHHSWEPRDQLHWNLKVQSVEDQCRNWKYLTKMLPKPLTVTSWYHPAMLIKLGSVCCLKVIFLTKLTKHLTNFLINTRQHSILVVRTLVILNSLLWTLIQVSANWYHRDLTLSH